MRNQFSCLASLKVWLSIQEEGARFDPSADISAKLTFPWSFANPIRTIVVIAIVCTGIAMAHLFVMLI